MKSLRKSVKQVNFGQLAFQFVRDVQVEKLSLSDLDELQVIGGSRVELGAANCIIAV